MKVKCAIYPDDSKEFPWDENVLKAFKKLIIEKNIKCQMDDNFLLGFLRARKYDVERALRLLVNYYSARRSYPQFFRNLLPSKLEHVLSSNIIQFLPQPDQKGRYVLLFQLGNWDPSIVNVTDYFRMVFLLTDFQLNFHRTQQNGIVFLLNSAGLSPRHFFIFSPRIVNAFFTCLLRDTNALRIKEIHYVNLNLILKAMVSIVVPLLPFKMKKRIFLHSEMNTLHEYIHPKCLPSEFGGELPNFDFTEANQMIRENSEFFRINEEYIENYEENVNDYTEERLINEGHEDDKIKHVLQNIESKFHSFSEDPAKFLSAVQQDPNLEIPHFY